MSEYQYYEFLALDRPLTEPELREVRAVSTRARITPTGFINHYNWGDFRGDVRRFMTRYYDAFVYYANWGTRVLQFRLPRTAVDVELAKRYCPTDDVRLSVTGDWAILSLCSQDESGDWEGERETWMSSLAPLRADLLDGDLRCLYVAWLSCVERRLFADDEVEPPVPPGLADLTGPLQALAEFLRVDDPLLEAAAEASALLTRPADDVRPWIEALPAGEKDDLLCRLMREPPAAVQRELKRRFRHTHPSAPGRASSRTVGELLAVSERKAEELRRREAERLAAEQARLRAEAERARRKRLDLLAQREARAWQDVRELIATSQAKKYDQAVQLLVDLRDLARRDGREDEAAVRLRVLREAYRSRRALLQRLDRAEL